MFFAQVPLDPSSWVPITKEVGFTIAVAMACAYALYRSQIHLISMLTHRGDGLEKALEKTSAALTPIAGEMNKTNEILKDIHTRSVGIESELIHSREKINRIHEVADAFGENPYRGCGYFTSSSAPPVPLAPIPKRRGASH